MKAGSAAMHRRAQTPTVLSALRRYEDIQVNWYLS